MKSDIEQACAPETRSSKIRLTKRSVEAAIASHRPERRDQHWFLDVPGMYLLVTPKGCASYCLRFGKLAGGKSDYTIRRANVITPDMAKETARAKLAELTLKGTDPVEARKATRTAAREKKVDTFGALAEAFMAARENRQLAKRTTNMRRWLLDKHILPRIGSRPVADLRRANVKECLREIQGSVEANGRRAANGKTAGSRTAAMCHGLIGRIFNWAMGEDRCENNPAAFPKLFNDTPEKRIGALNDDRLRAIWMALEGEAAKGWGTATAIAVQLDGAHLATSQRNRERPQRRFRLERAGLAHPREPHQDQQSRTRFR